jgi:hypothetical protein
MVEATNRANAEANKIWVILRSHFAQFVGKKIYKKSGDLMANVVVHMPLMPNGHSLQICRDRSDHALNFVVKVAADLPDNSCVYYSARICIGEISGGVLTDLHNIVDRRTDYTFEEIMQKREDIVAAKKVYDAAKSALYPFEEFYS